MAAWRVAIRGGQLDRSRLAHSAELAARDERIGRPALSVFVADGDQRREAVRKAARSVPHATVHVAEIQDLLSDGFRLQQTGRNSDHYTVTWPETWDLAPALERFIGCFGPNERKPE